MSRSAILLFGVAITACGVDAAISIPNGVWHPVAASLFSARSGVVVQITDAAASHNLRVVAKRLETDSVIWSIGSLQGEDSTVFGRFADVAIIGGDSIVVLDDRYGRISIYDPNGGFYGHIAGPGTGPAELTEPISLLPLDSQRVGVLDRGNRIQVFSIGHRQVTAEWEVDMWPRDICAFSDSTFYAVGVPRNRLKPTPDLLITELDASGAAIGGFGGTYATANPLVREVMDDSRIECIPSQGLVIAAYTFVGEVHAYTTDGRLQWIAKLSPFKTLAIVERKPRNSVYRGLLPPDVSEGFALYRTAVLGDVLAVQYAQITEQSAQENSVYHRIHTFLIESSTGKSYYVGSNLQPIVGEVQTGLITFEEAIVPTLQLRATGNTRTWTQTARERN